MTYANDGRFPGNCAVLVRYPLASQGPRESWPWLPGVVLAQCGPDEWEVSVTAPELAGDEGGEVTYPVCFRDASELRLAPDGQ